MPNRVKPDIINSLRKTVLILQDYIFETKYPQIQEIIFFFKKKRKKKTLFMSSKPELGPKDSCAK